MFGQISGYHDLAKSTRKIHHHKDNKQHVRQLRPRMEVEMHDDSWAPPPAPVTCSQETGPQSRHAGLLTCS